MRGKWQSQISNTEGRHSTSVGHVETPPARCAVARLILNRQHAFPHKIHCAAGGRPAIKYIASCNVEKRVSNFFLSTLAVLGLVRRETENRHPSGCRDGHSPMLSTSTTYVVVEGITTLCQNMGILFSPGALPNAARCSSHNKNPDAAASHAKGLSYSSALAQNHPASAGCS